MTILSLVSLTGLAPLGAFAAVLFRLRDVRPFGLRRVSWRWLLVGAVAVSIGQTVVVVTVSGPPSNLQADDQAASAGGALALVATIFVGAVLTPVAFVVGLISVLLLRRPGSIWPGVVVHAVNNSYAIVVPAVLGTTVSG